MFLLLVLSIVVHFGLYIHRRAQFQKRANIPMPTHQLPKYR